MDDNARHIARQIDGLNLRYQTLAKLLGVSYYTVRRWRHGHSRPSGAPAILLRLMVNGDVSPETVAAAAGVDKDELHRRPYRLKGRLQHQSARDTQAPRQIP